MSEFRADLHCHTICSDGSMSPEELVSHAKKIGLSGLCITDHDTVNAYETAIPAAKKAGILLGAGVEFSTVEEGSSVHVLGYDIEIHHPQIQALCGKHIERRKERIRKILLKLNHHRMPLDFTIFEKECTLGRPVGRPHIALILVEKGYVRSVQEAFDRFLGDGKPCFDPGEPISTDETLVIIHAAGGKAFIAHPHLLKNKRLISKLLKKPFQGIECYYSKCNPDQEKKWLDLAKQKGLLISGGSDFHGAVKPAIPLGCSWVNQDIFDKIFQKHRWQ